MGYIYMITNDFDDMKYIGQTTKTPEIRFATHLLCAKNMNYCNKLYTHIRYLGVEHFHISTLANVDDKCLDEAEIYYIKTYDTYNNGLNSNSGGNGSGIKVESKVEKQLNGIVYDYIQGMSLADLAIKYNFALHSLAKIINELGVERAEQVRSEKSRDAKPVVMYDLKFKALRKFSSKMEAIKYLEFNKHMTPNIMNGYTRLKEACAKGTTAFGFRWQLLDELTYDEITFNTKFDKEAYIAGGMITYNDIGAAECKNQTVSNARRLANQKICPICGGIKDKKARICLKCSVKIPGGHDSYKGRHMPKDEAGLWPASESELRKFFIDKNYTVNSIAEAYGVSYTTVNKYLKRYGIK